MSNLVQVLGWVVGITLLLSAGAKFQNPPAATTAIRNFVNSAVPPAWSGVLLALLEFCIGAGLLLAVAGAQGARRMLAAGAAGLLWAFFLGLSLNWLGGKRFSCNCFGPTDQYFGPATIWRGAVLAVAASFVALSPTAGEPDPLLEGLVAGLIVASVASVAAAAGARREWAAASVTARAVSPRTASSELENADDADTGPRRESALVGRER